MAELPPVEEYVTIEAWQYESGDIGWRIRSEINPSIRMEILSRVSVELTESLLEEGDKENPVVVSLFFQRKGTSTARWATDCEFRTRASYVWLKRKLYQSEWHLRGRKTDPKLLSIWWSVSWWWNRLLGRLRAPQRPATAAATALAPPPADNVSDASEAFQNRSAAPAQGPATVLPFRRS